jgi:hypothetical protein
VNAYIESGGEVRSVRAGRAYVDVGTINGYREAIQLLKSQPGESMAAPGPQPVEAGVE